MVYRKPIPQENTGAILNRGYFFFAFQYCSFPFPLLSHLWNFFHFSFYRALPISLSSTQPCITTGVLIFQQFACPSHLTSILNTPVCQGKLRTLRGTMERKSLASNDHKPLTLATFGRCSLQNLKTLSNTQWGVSSLCRLKGWFHIHPNQVF